MLEPKAKLEVYRDKSEKKEWRWRLVALNGNKIANSGEGYKNRKDAIGGFMSVVKNAAGALREHLGKSETAFELYKDRAKEWRWRLRHTNTRIIATPGEGYKNRVDMLKVLETIMTSARGAPVIDLEK